MKKELTKEKFSCRPAKKTDYKNWLKLTRQLWPDVKPADFPVLFSTILKSPRQASLLCFSFVGQAIAFANISLRVDYVEGSDSSPVGYLEGIFVEREYRQQGIARLLVNEAEKWAYKKGAREMGSDTEAHNKSSQQFHQAIGYKKAGTIVHFIKKLKAVS